MQSRDLFVEFFEPDSLDGGEKVEPIVEIHFDVTAAVFQLFH